MKWQEGVFVMGGVFFALALLPTLFDEGARVPLSTSIPTGAFLLLYGVAFRSLGQRYGAITTAVTGLVWLLIAAVRH